MISHRQPGPKWRCFPVIATWLIILLAGWGLAAPPVLAKSTTADQAFRLVDNWLGRNRQPLGTAMGTQIHHVQVFRDAVGQELYFAVYLDPQGFVIVPADDSVEPVIAFAPGGHFDPSADNPLGAMISKDLPQRLRQARELEALPEGTTIIAPAQRVMRDTRRKWAALLKTSPAAQKEATGPLTEVSDLRVAPLLQSKWYQTYEGGIYCYNYYTPYHYACGCVATALAQLMRYHKFPSAGVGTPSFTISAGGASMDLKLRGGDGYGGPYHWDNMVLDPDAYTSDEERQAIGALTYDAGVASKMEYTATGSGATFADAYAALLSPFGYSNAIMAEDPGFMTTYPIDPANLIKYINPNLDAQLPALLGIFNPQVGHAVVADGYGFDAGTPYHHLNLGWAGTGDAWYNLPSISIFTVVDYCIYNIFPSGTGEIISGRVVDAQANPLEGVTVTATRDGGGTFTATTNARGIYALAPVPSASTYHLQAAKEGYTFSSRTLTIDTSTNTSLTTGNRWGLDFSEPIPLPQALDNLGLTFTTSGNAPWYGQAATALYDRGAAQSGSIIDNQTSSLETTVVGPGKVTFFWKVSSERSYDWLTFIIDNSSPRASITGEVDWEQRTIAIPKGRHTLKWVYTKDNIRSKGTDCAWVDQVVYRSTGTIPATINLLLSD